MLCPDPGREPIDAGLPEPRGISEAGATRVDVAVDVGLEGALVLFEVHLDGLFGLAFERGLLVELLLF